MTAGKQMHFVFSVIGTSGDAFPCIALGRELVERGHSCYMLTNESFASQLQDTGIQFVPVSPKQVNNDTSVENNFGMYLFPSYQPSMEFFREKMFSPQNTLVIQTSKMSPAASLCELFSLPLCEIVLAPNALESTIDPPWPMGRICDGPLGDVFRKYGMITYKTRENPYILDNINVFRKDWGMSQITSTLKFGAPISKKITFFPPWFGNRPSDWPDDLVMTNFPLPKSNNKIPAKFVTLADSQGPPIVFTPGTGIPDVDEFFEHARLCCEALQMPGVFLSPYASSIPSAYGPEIVQFDFIDLQIVLPKSRLLVHHGGIGTTARAIEAGVPQIVIPRAYDQFDNGHRVKQLGVGTWIDEYNVDGDSLANSARKLLQSTRVQTNLALWKKKLQSADGIAECATQLESVLTAAQPVP